MNQTRKPRGVRATEEGRQKLRQAQAAKRNDEGKRLSYENIGEKAGGIDPKTVGRFFRGEPVDRDSAIAIAQALGLKVTEVVDPNEWNPPEQTSSAIPWHSVCRTMLEPQRELASNLFTSSMGTRFEVDDIHVPLGLVERQQKPTRQEDFSPELGSRVYQEEKITPIDYDDFFQKVLAQGQSFKSKGRRLSIIGEPGSGKTTQLLKIAEWVLAENLGLPILISLGAFGTKPLHQYLKEDWLREAAGKLDAAPPEWVRELEQCLQDGQVWLLLDSADEMGVVDALGTLAQQLRVPLLKNVRVVLTARLNLWDAGGNALSDFDTYKVLDFSYKDSKNQDQVKQFIDKWFGRSPLNPPFLRGVGGDLRTALDEKGKERIKDLVRNPLRLALLCYTWQSGQGKLPNTKAELYSVFVEALYELKKGAFPTTSAQRGELNAALGRLALKAIDTGAKSILPHRLVYEELEKPHPELFKDALNLGWLNRIGVDPQNPLKCVYAFFHPTFQEYFAATAIDNWHFFLNHIPHNPDIGTYRIFEPQWKEVILLWLGLEDVPRKQKEKFIQALVEFEDGCGYCNFYRHRAYFLAASGIAEFEDCSEADVIVEQMVEWGFDYLGIEEQEWVKLAPIAEAARAVILETERTRAITTLEDELIENSQDEYIYCQVAKSLLKIDPSNSKAIEALEQSIENCEDEYTRYQAAKSLLEIDPSNSIAIRGLVSLFQSFQDEDMPTLVVGTLDYAIDLVGNPIAINALGEAIQNSQNEESRVLAAAILGKINPGNSKAIRVLEQSAKNSQDESTRHTAAVRLEQISPGNSTTIETLRNLIQSQDEFIRRHAAVSLLSIDAGDSTAIQVLEQLIKDSQDEFTRRHAAESLLKFDRSNSIAIEALEQLSQISQDEKIWDLVDLIQDRDEDISWDAAWELKEILPKAQMAEVVTALRDDLSNETDENDYRLYENYYEVIWHCAQTLLYPAFYQAWHDLTLTPPS